MVIVSLLVSKWLITMVIVSLKVSKWLITMVIVSLLNGVIPLINGRFMACNWDDPPSNLLGKLPNLTGVGSNLLVNKMSRNSCQRVLFQIKQQPRFTTNQPVDHLCQTVFYICIYIYT